jgi:hypothetical protein
MRNLALSIAVVLVLAVVSPAFAQPFADVPTDHWAFDAIAELAAKGIIEGFPDGTFKGDRGVSRYEVAMIVARILARIEAIKIPAPAAPAPRPEVTRTDVQTIQRLVNEFRAELAALGVRVTAVEEELTALKAKTSNVTIKGDVRLRWEGFPTSNAFSRTRYRNRITVTGSASPNSTVVARLRIGQFNFNSPSSPVGGAGFGTTQFDYAYADFNKVFGFNWRLGQQAYTLGTGVGWSGYGLLFDPSNAATYEGTGVVSGAKVTGSFAGFNLELGGWTVSQGAGFNIYTVRAETGGLLPGWTIGAAGIYQARNTAFTVPTTLAGANSGCYPASATCVTTATAAANSNDTGYQVDVVGNLFPGLGLGAAYSTFTPNTGGSSNAYAAWVSYDLSSLGLLGGMSPTLNAWYKNFGSATSGLQIPYYTGAATDIETGQYTSWNFNGWGAALALKIGGGWSGTFAYETGTQNVGGQSVNEYLAQLDYPLADRTTLSFVYLNAQLAGVVQDNFYRIQLTYSY